MRGGNQTSSPGSNRVTPNLRTLQDDRKLEIRYGQDGHAAPTPSRHTRALAGHRDRRNGSEEKARGDAEKSNNQKPEEANQSRRERFGGNLVGGGMYSGDTYAEAYQCVWVVQKIRHATSSSFIE